MSVVNIIQNENLTPEIIGYLGNMSSQEIDAFTFGTLFTMPGVPVVALHQYASAALDRIHRAASVTSSPTHEPAAPPAPAATGQPSSVGDAAPAPQVPTPTTQEP